MKPIPCNRFWFCLVVIVPALWAILALHMSVHAQNNRTVQKLYCQETPGKPTWTVITTIMGAYTCTDFGLGGDGLKPAWWNDGSGEEVQVAPQIPKPAPAVPFDLPAIGGGDSISPKVDDGMGHDFYPCPREFFYGQGETTHGWKYGPTCKDVAPDWKLRAQIDTMDGKHHCYALYLLNSQGGNK